MRTEAILSGMEEMARRRQLRQRRRLFRRILREVLRAAMMLIVSAAAIFVVVPVADLLMQSWGSRLVIELAASFAVILWIGERIYH